MNSKEFQALADEVNALLSAAAERANLLKKQSEAEREDAIAQGFCPDCLMPYCECYV